VRANRLQELPARVTGTISPDLEATMAGRGTLMTVDELLAQARAMLPHRPAPAEARYAQARVPSWWTSAATTSGATG
jgi:hypothetical protein